MTLGAGLGGVFFFPGGPFLGPMGVIGEVGLEAFCYYLADYPDLVPELLEVNTLNAVAWVEHLPARRPRHRGGVLR
jgi:hypothetical protein